MLANKPELMNRGYLPQFFAMLWTAICGASKSTMLPNTAALRKEKRTSHAMEKKGCHTFGVIFSDLPA